MPDAFTIEPAAPADFLEIAALDRTAWPVVPDTYIPDGEHVWRVWCEHADVLVARPEMPDSGGGHRPSRAASAPVIAALVMFPTRDGELFLHKIMVHAEWRGRGIGTALMRAALQRAAAPVLLTVDPANAPAVRLYENMGFRVREHVSGYYRPHENRYVMVHPGGNAECRSPNDEGMTNAEAQMTKSCQTQRRTSGCPST